MLAALMTDPDAGHRSAAQIHRRLVADGRGLDLASVYRTVSTLVDLGVLHALSVEGAQPQPMGSCQALASMPRHHGVCTGAAQRSRCLRRVVALSKSALIAQS